MSANKLDDGFDDADDVQMLEARLASIQRDLALAKAKSAAATTATQSKLQDPWEWLAANKVKIQPLPVYLHRYIPNVIIAIQEWCQVIEKSSDGSDSYSFERQRAAGNMQLQLGFTSSKDTPIQGMTKQSSAIDRKVHSAAPY